MMPMVPKSKHEARLNEQHLSSFKPGSGERHTAECTIIEVYDQEAISLGSVPRKIAADLEENPGKLYARVKLRLGGRELIRPFREPEDQIYSTYGNAPLLEGRRAYLKYDNNRVEEGDIILARSFKDPQISIPAATETWDIGVLV